MSKVSCMSHKLRRRGEEEEEWTVDGYLPLIKLAQWFWRRRFSNFVNVFSLFRNYLPLEEGRTHHLNKFESPLPKDALCQVWLKLAQWIWNWLSGSGEDFLISSMYFRYLIIISPWKKEGPFFSTNLNTLHPRCFVPGFVEIGRVVLEKKIFKFHQGIFNIS